MEIEFERHSSDINNPFLDVVIRHKGDQLFQSTSRNVNLLSAESLRIGKIQVTFNQMPVNVDYVDFYFSLLDGQTCEILDWKRDFRLFIDRNEKQTGSLSLDVKWEVLS